jgi:hypothetical protein
MQLNGDYAMPTEITTMDSGQYQTEAQVRRRIRESLGFKGATVSRWISMGALPDYFFRRGIPKRYYLTTQVDSWITSFSGI